MCSWPANQLWPYVAVGRGDGSVKEGCRVENQGILTQGNGSVMGYALESAEDHSSTLSCLLLPPLSCSTASLTPNTHCVFSHFSALVPPPQPLSLSSCPSLTAPVFHFSTRSGTSWGSRHLVNRLRLCLWLKNTFVLLWRGRNVSLRCWLLSGVASLVSLEYWFIRRSEVNAALGTLKQTRLCPLSKRASVGVQCYQDTYFVKYWNYWLCGKRVNSIWLVFKKCPPPPHPALSIRNFHEAISSSV